MIYMGIESGQLNAHQLFWKPNFHLFNLSDLFIDSFDGVADAIVQRSTFVNKNMINVFLCFHEFFFVFK